jgi:hypothetical protein
MSRHAMRASCRTQAVLTARDFLKEVGRLSLDWPGKTVRLERDSLYDHWQRPVSHQPSIAELYHENSKLFDAVVGELVASRTNVEELRRTVAEQRSGAMRERGGTSVELPSAIGELLVDASSGLESALFAVEIRVLIGANLAIFDPVRKAAYAMKVLAPAELSAVDTSLTLMGTAPSHGPGRTLFFVTASLARNQILFGPRGYRRSLLEAGQVCQRLLDHIAASGLAATVWFEFADRPIDAAVEVDGIEEATIAVIEAREKTRADHG